MDILLKPMVEGHLNDIMVIEEASHKLKWPLKFFEQALSRGYHCRVMVAEDKVVAYIITHVIEDTAYPLNIAVDKNFLRLNLASRLFDDLVSHCRDNSIETIRSYVRADNEPIKRFNHKHGYKKIGVLKDYYGHKEDAIICVRSVNDG